MTVEMPIVWVMAAAGLGTRGEVMPCVYALTASSATSSMGDNIVVIFFLNFVFE